MAAESDWLRVSYSSLNTFSSCNRKFEFSKLYDRRPYDGDSHAADVGSALHKGYQDYLTNQDVDSAIWEYMLAYPYESEYQQNNDYRSLEAGLSVLEEMIDSAPMTDYELAMIRKPDGTIAPAIEVPFEIRFKGLTLPDGRGIAFTGFIDAIMRNIINDRYRTLDIKTHRRSIADATPKYKFDDQQTPYGIVVEHIQGNSIDEFEVLYLDSYVDVLTPEVKLYPFARSQDDIQEWLLNKVMQFQSIQRFMELEYFPRTSNGCLFFNKPCFYLEPCQSRDRAMVQEWLLLGNEPAPSRYEVPWVIAEIDPFGG